MCLHPVPAAEHMHCRVQTGLSARMIVGCNVHVHVHVPPQAEHALAHDSCTVCVMAGRTAAEVQAEARAALAAGKQRTRVSQKKVAEVKVGPDQLVLAAAHVITSHAVRLQNPHINTTCTGSTPMHMLS